MIGSPALMTDNAVDVGRLAEEIERLESSGQTVIVTATDGRTLGLIGIADVLRPQASAAMADLHRVGIRRLVMLTGDNPRTAAAVAAQVGVDDFHAALKPEDKSRIIGELTSTYGHVAMVGDGVNDAPALAAASVGIAMGTAGSDVALETADVALMGDDLAKLVDALELGRRTRRIVRQNIVLGLAILVVLVPGALIGLFSLPVAVLAHELSELFVITNGLRAARRRQ